MNLKKKLCALFLMGSFVLNCFSVNSTVINFNMNPCELLNESDEMVRSTEDWFSCFFQNLKNSKEIPIDLKKLEIILVNKFSQQLILSEDFLKYMEDKLNLVIFFEMNKKYDESYIEMASVMRKMIIADLSEKKYEDYINSYKIWECCFEVYQNKYFSYLGTDYCETMRCFEMCKFCRGRQFKAQGHVRASGGFFEEACSFFLVAEEYFRKVGDRFFEDICSKLYTLSYENFEKKISYVPNAILPVTDLYSQLNAKYLLNTPELISTNTNASVSGSESSESVLPGNVHIKEMIHRMFRFMPWEDKNSLAI